MASDDLAIALQLALSLERPLLLEGAAGVGKTEIAQALATVQNTQLIRLQCYEGLDAAQAIYEWNYQRQLLSIRAAAEEGVDHRHELDRVAVGLESPRHLPCQEPAGRPADQAIGAGGAGGTELGDEALGLGLDGGERFAVGVGAGET